MYAKVVKVTGLVIKALLFIGALLLVGVGIGLWSWAPWDAAPTRPDRPRGDEPSAPHSPPARRSAQLRVRSLPSGAAIQIDGRSTGRFTPDLIVVSAGVPLRLSLEREGREPWSIVLDLRPGEVREVAVELQPSNRR